MRRRLIATAICLTGLSAAAPWAMAGEIDHRLLRIAQGPPDRKGGQTDQQAKRKREQQQAL